MAAVAVMAAIAPFVIDVPARTDKLPALVMEPALVMVLSALSVRLRLLTNPVNPVKLVGMIVEMLLFAALEMLVALMVAFVIVGFVDTMLTVPLLLKLPERFNVPDEPKLKTAVAPSVTCMSVMFVRVDTSMMLLVPVMTALVSVTPPCNGAEAVPESVGAAGVAVASWAKTGVPVGKTITEDARSAANRREKLSFLFILMSPNL